MGDDDRVGGNLERLEQCRVLRARRELLDVDGGGDDRHAVHAPCADEISQVAARGDRGGRHPVGLEQPGRERGRVPPLQEPQARAAGQPQHEREPPQCGDRRHAGRVGLAPHEDEIGAPRAEQERQQALGLALLAARVVLGRRSLRADVEVGNREPGDLDGGVTRGERVAVPRRVLRDRRDRPDDVAPPREPSHDLPRRDRRAARVRRQETDEQQVQWSHGSRLTRARRARACGRAGPSHGPWGGAARVARGPHPLAPTARP